MTDRAPRKPNSPAPATKSTPKAPAKAGRGMAKPITRSATARSGPAGPRGLGGQARVPRASELAKDAKAAQKRSGPSSGRPRPMQESAPRPADGSRARRQLPSHIVEVEAPRAARGVIDVPRELVLRRLVEQASRYPNLDPKPLDTDRLPLLDGAFAHAIYDACIRHWLSLAAVIQAACGKPVSEQVPVLQAVLLCGAAQLLVLDKVPPHAAVDSSVEWAKASAGEGAGRFTNAVLRRVSEIRQVDAQGFVVRVPWTRERDQFPLSDGQALKLRTDCFAEEAWPRLAQATSHPKRLAEHWLERFGEEVAGKFLAHGCVVAPTIINAVADASVADESKCEPHERKGFYVFNGDRAGLMSLLDRKPLVRVQDPTAAAAVTLLVESGALKGIHTPMIIDVCAGQGTKSRQLAAEIKGARIIASDTEARRMNVLERLATLDPAIEALEPKVMRAAYTGVADVVLLDVPCSNSGVVARRLEARYRLDGHEIGRMVTLQRAIIGDALRLLKHNGILVYSTCSIEREENQEHTASLLSAGYTLLAERETLPQGQPGDDDSKYHDGGYAVVLRRGK